MNDKKYKYMMNKIKDCRIPNKEREIISEDIKNRHGELSGIDENIIKMIKYLNESGFETVSCCSGIFSDHYNIEKLKNKNITMKDIENCCKHRGRSFIPDPYIQMKGIFHTYDEENETYIVDKKYYEFEKSICISHMPDSEITCDNIGNERTPKWVLCSTASYSPPFLYELRMYNTYKFFTWADSFEEYDEIIDLANERLFNRIKKYTNVEL